MGDDSARFLNHVNVFLQAVKCEPISAESKFARVEFSDHAFHLERYTEFSQSTFFRKEE